MNSRLPSLVVAACLLGATLAGCAPTARVFKVGEVDNRVRAEARMILGTRRFQSPWHVSTVDVVLASPLAELASAKGTEEAALAKGRVELSETKGFAEPAEAKGVTEPSGAKGAIESSAAKGETALAETKGDAVPSETKGTAIPAPAKGALSSSEAKGETRPQIAKGDAAIALAKGFTSAKQAKGAAASKVAKGDFKSEEAKGDHALGGYGASFRLEAFKGDCTLGLLVPAIVATKEPDRTSILPDEPIVFTITVTNRSPLPIRDLVVLDCYGTDLVLLAHDDAGAEVGAEDKGGGTVRFNVRRVLAVGESVSFRITVGLTDAAKARFIAAARRAP